MTGDPNREESHDAAEHALNALAGAGRFVPAGIGLGEFDARAGTRPAG